MVIKIFIEHLSDENTYSGTQQSMLTFGSIPKVAEKITYNC